MIKQDKDGLEEHATICPVKYRMYCPGCGNATSYEDYPSDAAEEAWDRGYRIVVLDNEEEYVFCGKCIEDGVYKSWNED